MTLAKYILVVPLVCGGLIATAYAERVIKPSSRFGMERETLISSQYDFSQQLSLKVRSDPDLIEQERLDQIMKELNITGKLGLTIENIALSTPLDLILAYEGGSLDILSASVTPSGREVRASFRNSIGQFIAPKPGEIKGFDFGGNDVCFTMGTVEEHLYPSYFSLLIDKSGSMENVIDDVNQAASAFMSQLPGNSQCRVLSFNNESTPHHSDEFMQCNAPMNLSITAGGGTDIYTPMASEFNLYKQIRFDNSQKAVIIITDGQIDENTQKKSQLMKDKGETLNFVYFLGQREERHLEGIADSFLKDEGNMNFNLDQYFKAFSNMVNTQRVLSQVACS